MERIVEKDEFDIVTLENVVGMLRVSPITGISDSQHVQQRLQARGYWVTVAKLYNGQLGALVARDRWWLVAIRGLIGDPEKIETYFHNILRACLVDGPMFEHDVCIDFSSDIRERRAQRLGLPQLAGTGERLSKRGDKEEPGWKDVHYDYFLKLGEVWPPTLSEAPHINVDGVRAREQQVVFLCDKIWPMPEEEEHKYLDVNPKIEFVLQQCLSADADTGNFVAKKSPWRNSPRIIVGQTKLILRYRETDGGPVIVRAAEASEYMRLIGWDDSQWANRHQRVCHSKTTRSLPQASRATLGARSTGCPCGWRRWQRPVISAQPTSRQRRSTKSRSRRLRSQQKVEAPSS